MESVRADTKSLVSPREGEYDCLVDLIHAAENAKEGVEDNPELAAAMDNHVFIEAIEGESDLMCERCPVTCTVKSVGESAICLVNNREECVDKISE